MVIFTPLQKEEKNEETKPIFVSSYLTWSELIEIWNVGYWQWRASLQWNLPSFVQVEWSYVCMKIALLFFLSIYSWVWHTDFLGRMTTIVCLDI